MLKNNIKKILKQFIIVYPYNIIIMDMEDLKRWNLTSLEPIKLIPKI